MNGILISAMLQSQQAGLPTLYQPQKYIDVIKNNSAAKKFIAHCEEENKESLLDKLLEYQKLKSAKILPTGEDLGGAVILIGPEGDFTKPEIDLALQNDFIPVSLGDTRLRTETAGIVAATLMRLV